MTTECLGFLFHRLRRGGSRNLREKNYAEIMRGKHMGETQGLTRPGKHMVNRWLIYG